MIKAQAAQRSNPGPGALKSRVVRQKVKKASTNVPAGRGLPLAAWHGTCRFRGHGRCFFFLGRVQVRKQETAVSGE